MVWLYYCQPCERGDHAHCELATPSYPPGSFGGRSCTCTCKGKIHTPDPKFILPGSDKYWADMRKDFEKIKADVIDFEERSKRANLIVGPLPPKTENTLNLVQGIQKRISNLQKKIDQIQSKCSHEKVDEAYRASTGNYDPYNDKYWTDYHCQICDKKWTLECIGNISGITARKCNCKASEHQCCDICTDWPKDKC